MEPINDDEIFSNNICFDCFSENVEYCSINNAIFICRNCAQEHSKLGKNISFLIKTTTKIDPFLSVYIQRGGNDRLYKFLKQFNLQESPVMIKYKTMAAEWYRRLLHSEVNCDEPPQVLNYEEYSKMVVDNSFFMEWNFDDCRFEDNKYEYYDNDGKKQDLYASSISESSNFDNYQRHSFHKSNQGSKIYELDLNKNNNNNGNNNNLINNNLNPPQNQNAFIPPLSNHFNNNSK